MMYKIAPRRSNSLAALHMAILDEISIDYINLDINLIKTVQS